MRFLCVHYEMFPVDGGAHVAQLLFGHSGAVTSERTQLWGLRRSALALVVAVAVAGLGGAAVYAATADLSGGGMPPGGFSHGHGGPPPGPPGPR